VNAETPSINLDNKIFEKYKKMEMVYLMDQEFYAYYKLIILIERAKSKDDLVFQLESILPTQGIRSECYRSIPFALHILREFCSVFKIEIDKIYLPEVKRGILSTLGSNLVIKDKRISVDIEKSILPLRRISKDVNEIKKALEPLNTQEKQAQFEQSCIENPVVLRDLESNQNFRFQRATAYL
jgi:hypothetical protein